MNSLRFNDALRLAAEIANADTLPAEPPVGVIRDIYGRMRFAVDARRPVELSQDEFEPDEVVGPHYPLAAHEWLSSRLEALGAYAASKSVLYRDDFTNPDLVFRSADWHLTRVPGGENPDGSLRPDRLIHLLDRQVVGQDWLRTDRFEASGHPPRVVFYGLKGGVGRSTALAMLAYRLARDGRRVLLIDFDLESPGLSGLLLPQERVAGWGVVDWFVEDAVGQGDTLLADMVSDSPLAEHTPGSIRVAAAMGQGERAYLDKLVRVYADVPSPQGPVRFAERMRQLTEKLEARERPDVVLIDSRAGLHDLAAIAIGSLASVALLFATDSQQNWQGYRQLFGHWQQRPDVLRKVRERIVMVQALFPESDPAARAERFLQASYDLFAEHVYDEIPPGADADAEVFSFDLHSEDAPHFPMRVRWNARFQEFDPLVGRSAGGVDDTDIDLAFGPFVDAVVSALPELTHA